MKNRTSIQLNLNSIDELQDYLRDNPPRTQHAISNGSVFAVSFPESEPGIAAQLFKKFLLDMGLKDFKGWNLTTVNFAQIDTEFSMKNNKTDDGPSVFSHLNFSEADLEGVQLSHLDFTGSNFTRANLKFANLSNVSLVATSLIQTDFFGAVLLNASLSMAQASKANFKTANLKDSTILWADFSDANFTRANLSNTFFMDTNLTGAYFKQADFSNGKAFRVILRQAEFVEADLTEANLAGCDLSYANLAGADLTRANFYNATLNHARLQEAVLVDSDLRYAKLSNSNLTEANLENANLSNAELNSTDCRDSRFVDTDLTGSNLDASNLQWADLSRANLKGASLKYANLADASFRGANLEGLNLEGANVSRVNLQGAHLQDVLLYGVNNFFILERFLQWEDLKRSNPEKYPVTPSEPQKSLGQDLAERCLPLPANGSPPYNCGISWEDIENHAFKGRETCDVAQILVNSKEFLWSLREKDEAMQSLWLQLVDTLNIYGSAQDQDRVRSLIHYEKLAPLLSEAMQSLEINANQLKNDSIIADVFPIPAIEFSSSKLLSTLRSSQNGDQAKTLKISFNTTLPNLDTISFQNLDPEVQSHSRYDINFDFLSYEIREVLDTIQSISIYKWPLATQVIFTYQLKPSLTFDVQQLSWLRNILNMTQYSQLSEGYPEIFKPCETSCVNLTLADRNVIRSILVNLINPSTFAKPIENFTRNLISIVPYKTVLHFKDGMDLMLDDKKNMLGYSNSNQSAANIIQTYSDTARRLNMTLVISNNATQDLFTIGHKRHEAMQNDQAYKSHFFANGDENHFIINAGSTKLNATQFPLPDVVLYAHNQATHSILDFRNLAQQIKRDFNATLSVVLSTERNDLILKRMMLISSNQTQEDIPVISIRLQDALIDRGYKNLQIIPNTTPTKIIGRGLKKHLQPFPLQLNASDDATYFVRIKKIEANTPILIPRTIDQYSFFRSGDDLVLTNAFSPLLKINRLCNVVLQSFYQEPSNATTCSLEFINKKIVLREEQTKIFNLTTKTWSNVLLQHKRDLYAATYKNLTRLSYVVEPRVWPWGQPSRICYSRYRRSINLPVQTEAMASSTVKKPLYANNQDMERAFEFYGKHDQMKVKHAPKMANKPKRDVVTSQPNHDSTHLERQQFTEKQIHVISPRKDVKYDHRIDKGEHTQQQATKKLRSEPVLVRDTRSKNSRQFFSASHTRPTSSAPARMAPMLMETYKKPFISKSSMRPHITHQYGGSHTKQPSSLSQVTAHVDVSSSLFALNLMAKMVNRGKYQTAHSSVATTKYQKMQRQNEKIEVKAQGFNLR
jgi:uncharacterized protein YjbI with pentapeptide repeats